MTDKKVVLVTGASSGFGQLTAKKLAAVGYWVFGTSRKSHPASGNVEMLKLDVTSDDSVQLCIKGLPRNKLLNKNHKLTF
ncbi:SDR family NAD(P)-dependent oxidoreductase, partial [uncultured Nostoc sp.]|uniref:SDR family NAD(P)-dependent oxidoreductase n=1 Tax=uncultured Nostoc sp. TaxID=340711 RepID=UPI0035CA9C88